MASPWIIDHHTPRTARLSTDMSASSPTAVGQASPKTRSRGGSLCSTSSHASTIVNDKSHLRSKEVPDQKKPAGDRGNLSLGSKKPNAVAARPSGHVLLTNSFTTLVEVVPFSWKCCRCDNLEWLRRPGHNVVEGPNGDASNPDGAIRDPPHACNSCHAPRCVSCIVCNNREMPIYTFGGENLMPDRLVPAGWKCCVCKAAHYGVAKYRRDLFVHVSAAADWNGNTPHTRGGGNSKCFFAIECRHRGHHQQPNSDSAATTSSDSDEAVRHHVACAGCQLLNRYGETLGPLNVESLILAHDAGALRDNLVWFQTEKMRMIAERKACGPTGEASEEVERKLAESVEALEEADRALDRAKEWVRQFMTKLDDAPGVGQRRKEEARMERI